MENHYITPQPCFEPDAKSSHDNFIWTQTESRTFNTGKQTHLMTVRFNRHQIFYPPLHNNADWCNLSRENEDI